MSFASVLDACCIALGCTNREIAQRCSISPSALSRYRNGERTPEVGSDVLNRLIEGITILSHEQGVDRAWREDVVRSALEATLSETKVLSMDFSSRLDVLMKVLSLRNADVAQVMGVSPSYISRIRNGQRLPSDQIVFADQFAHLAAQRCVELNKGFEIAELTGSAASSRSDSGPDVDSRADMAEIIEWWLRGNNVLDSDLAAVHAMLKKLDGFFFEDELAKLDALPPFKPNIDGGCPDGRFYYGSDHLRSCEIRFFDTAIANRAKEVFLSSDIPLLELTLASNFAENYRTRLGALVRNGTHITVLHNDGRSLAEMIVSLELWLPLYLTGCVTPYNLRCASNRLYCHMNYVCETCALTVDAVLGHEAEGRSYFTTREDEIAYCQKKAGFIMERATPLLEIFHDDDPAQNVLFEERCAQLSKSANAHVIAEGKYRNLHIVSFSGSNAAITVKTDPAIHLLLHHPKLCYVISKA